MARGNLDQFLFGRMLWVNDSCLRGTSWARICHARQRVAESRSGVLLLRSTPGLIGRDGVRSLMQGCNCSSRPFPGTVQYFLFWCWRSPGRAAKFRTASVGSSPRTRRSFSNLIALLFLGWLPASKSGEAAARGSSAPRRCWRRSGQEDGESGDLWSCCPASGVLLQCVWASRSSCKCHLTAQLGTSPLSFGGWGKYFAGALARMQGRRGRRASACCIWRRR